MTAVQLRPTLGSSCARATSAGEARYRINRPIVADRASRIIALDEAAGRIVDRLGSLQWSGDPHFLHFEAPLAVEDLEGLEFDAMVRATDGAEAALSEQLTGADVAVMVATADDGAQGASLIGQACFARGIMTAGLVIAEGRVADHAVAALRPHAVVLVVTGDEDDVPAMLTALRA